MTLEKPLTVMQLLPKLSIGGVERGTVQIADALNKRGHRSIVVCESGPLERDLRETGSEFFNWPIGRKHALTIQYARKIRNLCLSEKVDIVHARSRLPAWLGRLALSKIKKEKCPVWITTVHGPYSVSAYSKVMMSGDKIIAISNYIRDYITKNYPGVENDRIITIPRGVDETTHNLEFSVEQRWLDSWQNQMGLKSDMPLLTIPARLTRWKGQLDFLEILRILKERGVRFHALLVGGASKNKNRYKGELISKAKAANVFENCSFLGNRLDIKEIMSMSTVVFSVTKIPEAFGRTTAEALSLGTPVIGYEHGGTKEIMKDWYPYGLVSVGNVREAADRTERFLKSYPPVTKNKNFTLERMQKMNMSLYEGLSKKSKTTI
tara:strand:- start:3645 stop:4781 length:1137 start_codon:yes stop_codon:yes gene_type:complete